MVTTQASTPTPAHARKIHCGESPNSGRRIQYKNDPIAINKNERAFDVESTLPRYAAGGNICMSDCNGTAYKPAENPRTIRQAKITQYETGETAATTIETIIPKVATFERLSRISPLERNPATNEPIPTEIPIDASKYEISESGTSNRTPQFRYQ